MSQIKNRKLFINISSLLLSFDDIFFALYKRGILILFTKDINIKDININMCKNKHVTTSESVHLGILLAIVGGFLDAYTFVCRGGVFA